jgi:hypothetical protein
LIKNDPINYHRSALKRVDTNAYLHNNANMRTSIDFPDPLFRHLKARAAMEGASLRDLVLALIERGMAAPSTAATATGLPSVSLGAPMALQAGDFSNANLSALLDE